MTIESVRCPVLDAHVTREVDLEGTPVRVFCPEYDDRTGACRLKSRSQGAGPLAQLLDRVAEETLTSRSLACNLRMGGG